MMVVHSRPPSLLPATPLHPTPRPRPRHPSRPTAPHRTAPRRTAPLGAGWEGGWKEVGRRLEEAGRGLGGAWEDAGRRLGGGWEEAGRRLGAGWEGGWQEVGREAGRRLGGGWEQAGREAGRRLGGTRLADSRCDSCQNLPFCTQVCRGMSEACMQAPLQHLSSTFRASRAPNRQIIYATRTNMLIF